MPAFAEDWPDLVMSKPELLVGGPHMQCDALHSFSNNVNETLGRAMRSGRAQSLAFMSFSYVQTADWRV